MKVLWCFIAIAVVVSFSLVLVAEAQTTNAVNSQCTTGLTTADSLQPSEDLIEIAPLTINNAAIQIIAPEITFNCYGEITEWTVLVTLENIALDFFGHEIYLQVWRPSSKIDGKFELIGTNHFENVRVRTSDVNQDFNLTFHRFTRAIPEEDRIRFQPNDVLGWYSPSRDGLNPGFGVAAANNNESRLLIKTNYTIISSCELDSCDENVQSLSSLLPLISLQFEITAPSNSTNHVTCAAQPLPQSCVVTTMMTETEMVTTSLVTTAFPSTTPTTQTGVSEYVYIAVGLVIGVAVTLFIMLFFVALLCRKKNNDSELRQEADLPSTDANVAYGELTKSIPDYEYPSNPLAITSDPHLHAANCTENPAYSTRAAICTENPAYSTSGLDTAAEDYYMEITEDNVRWAVEQNSAYTTIKETGSI